MRGEYAIILFTESTCHSSLIAQITDVTTSIGAYGVNLLYMGMSVVQKMVDDQMTAATKKRDTVTLDRIVYDKDTIKKRDTVTLDRSVYDKDTIKKRNTDIRP